MVEIVTIAHTQLYHDSHRGDVRFHCECDDSLEVELPETELQRRKRAVGCEPLAPKTRKKAIEKFDSWREGHLGRNDFQAQKPGEFTADIQSPWSESICLPMLFNSCYSAE